MCTYLLFSRIYKQNPTLRNIQAYICMYIGVGRHARSNQSHKQNNPLLRHIHMHTRTCTCVVIHTSHAYINTYIHQNHTCTCIMYARVRVCINHIIMYGVNPGINMFTDGYNIDTVERENVLLVHRPPHSYSTSNQILWRSFCCFIL